MTDFDLSNFSSGFDIDSGPIGQTYSLPLTDSKSFTDTQTITYAKPRKEEAVAEYPKKRKLTTEQTIALVLLSLVLVGIVMMVLAFIGVFNVAGSTINLTPSTSPTGVLPSFIPILT